MKPFTPNRSVTDTRDYSLDTRVRYRTAPWFMFPTTPQERWRSRQSQSRRVVWLDHVAAQMQERWAKQQAAFQARREEV